MDKLRRPLMLWLVFLSAIFLLFLTASCDITKSAVKSKSETVQTEETETKTVRKGDTVTYEIPKIVLRDTTIYTYNRQGTRLSVVYDKNGQVSNVDCVASAIELYERKRTELEQSEKNKAKEKEEKVNTTWILYGFIAMVLIICFGFLLLFFYFRKNTAILTQFLNK